MSQCLVQCSSCGVLLSDLPEFVKLIKCPECGSGDRHITINDTLETHEQIRLKAKDPQKTGKKKIRRQVISGDDLHTLSGKWYKKTRIVDVDNDSYLERIIDPETGEVIHFCEEPLSDHKGHGSAKSKS